MLLLAALPSISPKTFPYLNGVKVDTDPENMLASDNPARILHRAEKTEFTLYDQIVLGVVNDVNPDGVFNTKTLGNIYALTEYAKSLEGVIAPELIAPSTVDNIEQAGIGAVSFNWLMPKPPQTEAEATQIRDAMLRLPMMRGSLIDENGKSLMLYIPIQSKDMSNRISTALLQKIDSLDKADGEAYHITGLPVANDTFGVQMFVQMAISAPMAMALIFALMLLFFKRFGLILSPMLVAMMTVIITMGALIASGQTIHIMSSMIPIFIMPIAVLDAVHILSEFYDRYHLIGNKRDTIRQVMHELWKPMFFTSLTTTAGFGSLMLAPIPPVQIFGGFIATGVMLAWLLTVTFIPAYILMLPEKSLNNFGLKHQDGDHSSGLLRGMARLTGSFPKMILALALLLLGISAYGISRIQINDNPVKWFEPKHRIRVADKILNERFSGTYPAYILIDAGQENAFKDPEMLNYLNKFQAELEAHPNVGKTTSVTAIVQTVYREMMEGNSDYYRIPGSNRAVAQTLLTFESSHRPSDLYHFVTPDFSKAVVWLQLNSGDNREMSSVVKYADQYMKDHPIPSEATSDWFGLTYINVIWQEKMVAGMLEALLSSFAIVLVLMIVLFRSVWWGTLSMIPLTLSIAIIYGIIGLVGKSYDMPVAVLSSLSLGLAVDYAIHFLARSRVTRLRHPDWKSTLPEMFGEPARAITRNIIVIGVGFTPLLLAPLVPYQTVGMLISAILLIAGLVSLLVLPALITVFEKQLFKNAPTE
ncbi:efflux RND transporter permease subunit [Coraliomargarita parva]|uniref:efflux RND transporter permease subunit n=1 Tax=Coraliomargarita parva TaxID=3014050 RepID=UPI0022B30187|nr:MMPL family transporter [Coraliomargarita parva]